MKNLKRRTVSSITIGDFYKSFSEELALTLHGKEVGFNKLIKEPSPNRPGLALAGFHTYFAEKRLQVFGNAELSYISSLDMETARLRFEATCEFEFPGIIIARGQHLPPYLSAVASAQNIPVFSSPMVTMKLLNRITHCLESKFADATSVHGCMVDYRGTGILIIGSSGSGKSETALGLLERGGALVADDIVHLKQIGGELIGKPPETTRGYIEMRGIGIVNVANLYGLAAISPGRRLDMVVSLKPHSDLNEVDRVGIKRQQINILDINIPNFEIPVTAGRDVVRLVDVAALELQLRTLGYDMADEFNRRLLAKMNPGLTDMI